MAMLISQSTTWDQTEISQQLLDWLQQNFVAIQYPQRMNPKT